jgi:hypothetical protein
MDLNFLTLLKNHSRTYNFITNRESLWIRITDYRRTEYQNIQIINAVQIQNV